MEHEYERTIEILAQVVASPQTATDLAQATAIGRTSVRRSLGRLLDEGLVTSEVRSTPRAHVIYTATGIGAGVALENATVGGRQLLDRITARMMAKPYHEDVAVPLGDGGRLTRVRIPAGGATYENHGNGNILVFTRQAPMTAGQVFYRRSDAAVHVGLDVLGFHGTRTRFEFDVQGPMGCTPLRLRREGDVVHLGEETFVKLPLSPPLIIAYDPDPAESASAARDMALALVPLVSLAPAPGTPTLVVVAGHDWLPGCDLGLEAEALGRSRKVIEVAAAISLQRRTSRERRGAWRRAYAAAAIRATYELRQGRAVICVGQYERSSQRRALIKAAKATGARAVVVTSDAQLAATLAREPWRRIVETSFRRGEGVRK